MLAIPILTIIGSDEVEIIEGQRVIGQMIYDLIEEVGATP